MGRKVFHQTPLAIDVDTTGLSFANRQLSVTAMDQVIFVQGDGGPIDITADPQIEAHESAGAFLTIVGMSDVNTLTFQNGDGLVLNGTAVLGENCVLELFWCGDHYLELGRNF